ncbi:MAG: hypothetical protein WD069_16445 [Planctomycetales bacterium]
MRQTNEMIEQSPAACMAVALGAGFGIGVMLGMASGTAFGSRQMVERSKFERFGRSVLDAVHNVLPETLARRVG